GSPRRRAASLRGGSSTRRRLPAAVAFVGAVLRVAVLLAQSAPPAVRGHAYRPEDDADERHQHRGNEGQHDAEESHTRSGADIGVGGGRERAAHPPAATVNGTVDGTIGRGPAALARSLSFVLIIAALRFDRPR